MKQGKNPTMAQKARLKALKLVPANWLVAKDCPECFVLVHRHSGEVKKLEFAK